MSRVVHALLEGGELPADIGVVTPYISQVCDIVHYITLLYYCNALLYYTIALHYCMLGIVTLYTSQVCDIVHYVTLHYCIIVLLIITLPYCRHWHRHAVYLPVYLPGK